MWTLEVFETDDGREPFTEWMNGLSEVKFAALDAALRLVLSERGLDLARTEWLKPIGEGVYEFRVRHDEDEITHMFGGREARVRPRELILLRVFVHFHDRKAILLLGGYDKGKDANKRRQEREIDKARKNLRSWRARRRRGTGPGSRT